MAHHWDFTATLYGFYLNPYVDVFFALAVGALYLGLQKRKEQKASTLSRMECWAVEWYWWNAWLFHMTMDGASGSFQLVPVVVHQYEILDMRFQTHHVVPWTIGVLELFVHGPMCLWTLYAILVPNHPLRWPLEIVTSMLHIIGMYVFVVAEVYEGQLNVPANDPVGVPGNTWANVKFDLYHLTYYWFGFWFCNLVWGFVPMYRIVRATQECGKAIQKQMKSS